MEKKYWDVNSEFIVKKKNNQMIHWELCQKNYCEFISSNSGNFLQSLLFPPSELQETKSKLWDINSKLSDMNLQKVELCDINFKKKSQLTLFFIQWRGKNRIARSENWALRQKKKSEKKIYKKKLTMI